MPFMRPSAGTSLATSSGAEAAGRGADTFAQPANPSSESATMRRLLQRIEFTWVFPVSRGVAHRRHRRRDPVLATATAVATGSGGDLSCNGLVHSSYMYSPRESAC